MILSDALRDPLAAQIHMERYVNRGSPSGFSTVNTTSPKTSHRGSEPTFWIHGVKPGPDFQILEFGASDVLEPGIIPLHPDLIETCPLLEGGKLLEHYLQVAPTSSDRTVQMISAPHCYLKLSYPPVIGRMSRHLGVAQAEAAVWVTNAIDRACDLLGPRFKFLREGYSRVAASPAPRRIEWGATVRDCKPTPSLPPTALIVPGFSLFSRDERAPDDEFLLLQLFERQHKSLHDFLMVDVISPLIDGYFSLLTRCGLQLEAHAQNMLFGVNQLGQVTSVIARDAESIDRDLSLMDELQIGNERPSGSYKVIRRSDYNYQIMHSFMFDFKMGRYLIQPIIDCAASRGGLRVAALTDYIRDHVREWMRGLPADFFPDDGCWYHYDNVIHDRARRRDYIATPRPSFR